MSRTALRFGTLLAVVGAGAIVLGVAGCHLWRSATQSPYISAPSISVHGRSVEVSGETDLPDGARMDFTAVHSAAVGSFEKSLSSLVSHGSYAVKFDLTGWPAGTHDIWVQFRPGDSQSAAVQELYGADGSKMHGGRIRHDPYGQDWEWAGAYDFTLE
jgi:hypothetical protein